MDNILQDIGEIDHNILIQLCNALIEAVNDLDGEEQLIVECILSEKKSHGLFLKELGKYRKIKEEGGTCSICLLPYEKGEYKRELPGCKHTYHKKCIDKWFKKDKKKSCPLCRHSFLDIYENCQHVNHYHY